MKCWKKKEKKKKSKSLTTRKKNKKITAADIKTNQKEIEKQ